MRALLIALLLTVCGQAKAADRYLANDVIINSAGFKNVFAFHLNAGETYKFTGLMFTTTDSPSGFTFRFSGSATGTFAAVSPCGERLELREHIRVGSCGDTPVFSDGSAILRFAGSFRVDNAGTFTVQIAVPTTTVKAGSIMSLEAISP